MARSWKKSASIDADADRGATVVITHQLPETRHAEYERWLREIVPTCQASPGYLDWHVVRAIAGLTETYTNIVRFDTPANLNQWIASPERTRLLAVVSPLLTGEDLVMKSGWDFLFASEAPSARPPKRWKQFLVTWSAILPLSLTVPWFVSPVLNVIGASGKPMISAIAVTGIMVFLMVYLVMPYYTKLIRRWLYS
jgi:antibiotic biosynthesis monooxygenase (ABM) superfamily enzyme